MKAVKLTKMVEALNLKNMTPEVDMGPIRITVPDINRPALQLTGVYLSETYGQRGKNPVL